MSKPIKLKDCPFCGGTDVRIRDHKGTIGMAPNQEEFITYTVECYVCGCCTDYFNSEAKAAKRWNRRKSDG